MHITRVVLAAAVVATTTVISAQSALASDPATEPAPAAAAEGAPAPATEGAEAAAHGSAIVIHSAGATQAWSTTGTKPTVTALTNGSWHVRLPGITAVNGAVVATAAPGSVSPTCNIDKVALHNGATAVWVRCFRNGNQPTDGFNLTYTSVRGQGQAWWTTTSAAPGDSTFKAVYNPGGPVTGSLNNVSGGALYNTRLTGATTSVFTDLNRHLVTAYGPGYLRCYNHGWSSEPTTLIMWTRCRNGDSFYVGGQHASYLFSGSLLPNVAGKSAYAVISVDTGTATPHMNVTWPWGNSGLVTATRAGKGVFQVRLTTGATAKPGVVHTIATNRQFGFSCPAITQDSGAAELITVYCYDAYGNPTDSGFEFHYFSPN